MYKLQEAKAYNISVWLNGKASKNIVSLKIYFMYPILHITSLRSWKGLIQNVQDSVASDMSGDLFQL